MSWSLWWLSLWLSLCLLVTATSSTTTTTEETLECSVTETAQQQQLRDPALKEMSYDIGDGPQTFWAYVEPDVTSFYENGGLTPPASHKVVPKFNGFAAKFINLSNQHVQHYWERHKGGDALAMRHYTPFSAGGTGSFPNHRFFFTPLDDPNTRLIEWVIKEYPNNLYVYDPYLVPGDEAQTEKNLRKALNKKERHQYDKWRKTLLFHEQYLNFTGRSYLAHSLRDAPQEFMWRADYFGQEHWVTTKETHFKSTPPLETMDPITATPEERAVQPRTLEEHRDPEEGNILNMTLKVLSCAPRVFEIPNFLSPSEVEHILEMAGGLELGESKTGDVGVNNDGRQRIDPSKKTKTRTSFNTWVPREKSPIIDAIYRRSADLLRMDEAILRYRGKRELPERTSKQAACEQLQLVHYDLTQEYTAHHDFGYSHIDDDQQGARFATLLFYLNEGMEGGETSFPRWVNAETFEQLKVTPELGKAVLFYSQLPDGNLDDFSQHAALPIKDGEKWLINLWVWSPEYK